MPNDELATIKFRGLGTAAWVKRTVLLLVCVAIVASAAYMARRTLLINVARVFLSHESGLVAQERSDAVAIIFPTPPQAWITPMKNQMNDIWNPIKANGVNYYMFAKPKTWFKQSADIGGFREVSMDRYGVAAGVFDLAYQGRRCFLAGRVVHNDRSAGL